MRVMPRRRVVRALAGATVAAALVIPASCSSFTNGPTGDDGGTGETGATEGGANETSTASPYETLVLQAKPVVYWRFATKTTAQPNLGSASITANASTEVRLGQPSLVNEPADHSIRLVARDTITSSATPDWFGGAKSYSIECWLRVEGAPIPADILMHGSRTTGVGLFFDGSGKLEASRFENGVGAKIGLTVLRAKENHHVVVTYDGALLTLFIDGKADESVPATTVLTGNTTTPLTFGTSTPSAGSPNLDAFVDEVAIYDRELTASEVMAHARSGGIFLP